MTEKERTALGLLIETFQRFEDRDNDWKQRTDSRLDKVEQYVDEQRAVAAQGQKIALSWRAKAGLVISAVGVSASIVLGVANALG